MLLSTDVWVSALIRRAELEGAFATVVRKGDARAGDVVIKAYDTANRTARLFSQSVDMQGEPLWIQPVASPNESELDAYLERRRGYDPDLWVVEIEDRYGRHFLLEKVEGEGPAKPF
ncbi:DUF1491 family protein [uncultured Brevundimonas sp.]|uniref:DUF1491 family protein n=1 Tax=uncultured Brevundimonas sp. TaxID=213418 RepID=UPI00263885F6|nr:DUF1491 family protein [uncultured Brevundimonas sp.]